MNRAWAFEKLGIIADIHTGKWDANHASENGKYRFYTCAYNFAFCDTKRFKGESLILPGNGVNVGEVFYYNGEFDAYQRTYVLQNIKIVPKYLFYHMLLHWKALGTKKQYGSATNFIKLGNFEEYGVSYPGSLEEQKRIVAILDETFAAIDKAKANLQRNLQNARELFQTSIQAVFANKGADWEEKRLGEIAFLKSGGTPLSTRKEFWNGNIPWYSSGELNNFYTGQSERTINELAIENSNAKVFPKGSLLIGMYDTAALKMSILDREGAFNQAIAGVKPNPNIDLKYILYFINSIKPEILNQRRGVRQKNLSLEKIKHIPIAFPNISIQKLIVLKLDELSTETKKLETLYRHKLQQLELFKKSILTKAFSGALTATPKTVIA